MYSAITQPDIYYSTTLYDVSQAVYK